LVNIIKGIGDKRLISHKEENMGLSEYQREQAAQVGKQVGKSVAKVEKERMKRDEKRAGRTERRDEKRARRAEKREIIREKKKNQEGVYKKLGPFTRAHNFFCVKSKIITGLDPRK
jgi:hypothetical protein